MQYNQVVKHNYPALISGTILAHI